MDRWSSGMRGLTIVFLLALVALCCPVPTADARLSRNAEEREVARLIATHPHQGRAHMAHDANLHLAARAKARDMARRDYFNHVDPNGIGPNRVLAMLGYKLPDLYSAQRAGNNVESIAAGTSHTPAKAFAAWLNSPGHRRHILASEAFYAGQTRFGVGFAESRRSKYKRYYVFMSAPPSETTAQPVTPAKIKLFLGKTPRQIERLRFKKR